MNAMTGAVYSPIKGTAPKVSWISCQDLKIDPGYQRIIEGRKSQSLINAIAQDWDWRLCGPIMVSYRKDANDEFQYFVIDGQHRLYAAKKRGDITELPCVISTYVSYEEEAMAFVSINSARRSVTALDRYHARIAAKEKLALQIQETVTSCDLTVTRHNDAEHWQAGEIAFPDAVGRCLINEKQGLMDVGTTELALNMLFAWHPKPLLMGKDLFAGLLLIAKAAWPDDFDEAYEKIMNHLSSKRQSFWVAARNAHMKKEKVEQPAQAMAQAILKGTNCDITLNLNKGYGLRRFGTKKPGKGRTLNKTHNAIAEGRTLFPSTCVQASENNRVLKSGHNSSKIGASIKTGQWSGYPIYTLTLEERATCPDNCKMLNDCYGNNMHLAQRFQHGPQLIQALERELEELSIAYSDGFVVRLHVLGDFYDMDYVHFWEKALTNYPALHIFGYTAHDVDQPIGAKLLNMSASLWPRFAMRFSSHEDMSELASIVVAKAEDCPDNAFVCPAQTGKTACCGTCGACWGTEKNVAFLKH